MNGTATLRCKMRVARVTRDIDGDGNVSSEQVKLQAVFGHGDTENAQWSKWTPSANLEITINNPSAYGKLSVDHEFYLDFTPANAKE